MASCGVKLFKYSFCLVNFLIFAISIAAIIFSSLLFIDLKPLAELQLDVPRTALVFLIIVCIGATFLTFLGWFGSVKDSPCLLNTYSFIIFLSLAVEIVALVFVFKYRDQIDQFVDNDVATSFLEKISNATHGSVQPVDDIQKGLQWYV